MPSTYLALGDSVAAGIGASDPSADGYVAVLAELLEQRLACDEGSPDGCPLQVRQLAVPGATTTTLLRDQLPRALELLEQQDVRLVTVTVGGNDVFLPVLQACATSPEAPACAEAVASQVRAVEQRLDRLLGALTSAVPAGTPVAVMAYYNPLSACELAPLAPLAEQVLEGRDGQPGLNDVLRTQASVHGAVLVETADRLSSREDFVGGRDCLHPSGRGHAAIARAFADAVQDGAALSAPG